MGHILANGKRGGFDFRCCLGSQHCGSDHTGKPITHFVVGKMCEGVLIASYNQ
jgi:hypothetical protein